MAVCSRIAVWQFTHNEDEGGGWWLPFVCGGCPSAVPLWGSRFILEHMLSWCLPRHFAQRREDRQFRIMWRCLRHTKQRPVARGIRFRPSGSTRNFRDVLGAVSTCTLWGGSSRQRQCSMGQFHSRFPWPQSRSCRRPLSRFYLPHNNLHYRFELPLILLQLSTHNAQFRW